MSLFASTKKQVLDDKEFGEVSIRTVAHAKYIRLRITQSGELKASMPPRTSLCQLRELIDSSRDELRKMVSSQSYPKVSYADSDAVGLSHTIHFVPTLQSYAHGSLSGQKIIIHIPEGVEAAAASVQKVAQIWAKKALSVQARAYLPRRLKHFAELYGYSYTRVRYSSAKGRWGSCSSSGTISVNIALMKLPIELIDYVLIHELVHTKHMNHSKMFWETVREHIPDTNERRKRIKLHNPYV